MMELKQLHGDPLADFKWTQEEARASRLAVLLHNVRAGGRSPVSGFTNFQPSSRAEADIEGQA